MKHFFSRIIPIFIATLFLFACNKNDNPFGSAKEGGLTEVKSPLVNYYLGITPQVLKAKLLVYQGSVKSTKIEIYKQYFTNDTALTHDPTKNTVISTNSALLKSIDITNQSETHLLDYTFSLSDLVSGLTLAGSPMPTSDATLKVGSYWTLTYKVTNGNGVSQLLNTTTVGIATRFAGTYKVKNQEYYRIGVFRPDVPWPTTYNIKSLDETTYRIIDYAGPFGPPSYPGNQVDFSISTSGVITYVSGQSFNGQPMITCASPLLTNVKCGAAATNTAVADFVNGKDYIIMGVGYNTAGSGPREWYVELEKVP